MVEGFQTKPKLVLLSIHSYLAHGNKATSATAAGDKIMVFKTWEEVKVFRQMCSTYQVTEEFNAIFSHYGVFDAHKLNPNRPRKDDHWNSFERIIQGQFVMDNLLSDDRAIKNFVDNNCIGNTDMIPTVLSGLMVFVTMEFIEQNNEYYLTELDACLADSSSVVAKLFWPISVPGLRPKSVHGERLVDGRYKQKQSGEFCKLYDEGAALKELFEAVTVKSKYCGNLVLFNLYLACSPLLAAVHRHGLTKLFYTTFTAVIEVQQAFKLNIKTPFPSLKEVTINQFSSSDTKSKSKSLRMADITSMVKGKLSPIARPISSLTFANSAPEVFMVEAPMSVVKIHRNTATSLHCKIKGNFLEELEHSYVFVISAKIPDNILISFEIMRRADAQTLHITLDNARDKSCKIQFPNSLVGCFQPHPSTLGILKQIPHLIGKQKADSIKVHKCTNGIALLGSKKAPSASKEISKSDLEQMEFCKVNDTELPKQPAYDSEYINDYSEVNKSLQREEQNEERTSPVFTSDNTALEANALHMTHNENVVNNTSPGGSRCDPAVSDSATSECRSEIVIDTDQQDFGAGITSQLFNTPTITQNMLVDDMIATRPEDTAAAPQAGSTLEDVLLVCFIYDGGGFMRLR